MIYIDSNKSTLIVYVPRNGVVVSALAEVELKAVSTYDKTAFEFTVASQETRGYMLRLVVGLPEGMGVGEYQYTLTAGEETISTGLLIVSEDSMEVLSYNREISYKQYGE